MGLWGGKRLGDAIEAWDSNIAFMMECVVEKVRCGYVACHQL